MNPVVETGAASVATGYLVSLFKHAYPSAPSWLLVLVALLAGQAGAFLIALSVGDVLTTQTVATNVLQGIGAAAIAAGLTRTDQSAEVRRIEARVNERLAPNYERAEQ